MDMDMNTKMETYMDVDTVTSMDMSRGADIGHATET